MTYIDRTAVNHNDEPAWVRDSQAASMELRIPRGEDTAEVLTDIFKGETYHCEMCGAAFPLWPPNALAGHYLKEHSAEFTVQGLASFSMMCLPAWNDAHQLFLHSQLFTRVGPRRRARELGLWHPVGGRIVPGAPQ
jgi:hypothetical protein